MSTETIKPDWADDAARMFLEAVADGVPYDKFFANLIRQAAANHYLPELRMAEEALAPFAELLEKRHALEGNRGIYGLLDVSTDTVIPYCQLYATGAALARIQALTQPTK